MRSAIAGFLIGLVALSGGARAQAPGLADIASGTRVFGSQCALCHGATGGRGPDLRGVVGRRAGAAAGYDYSQALQRAAFAWTPARLDAYLQDPQSVAPGTRMPVRVADATERRDVIAYLQTLHPGSRPASPAKTSDAPPRRVGAVVVFGDWRADAPGVRHRVTPGDLPRPYATQSAGNPPRQAHVMPSGATPRSLPGLKVTLFADHLSGPRLLRTAPNGDVFVAETDAGRVSVLRAPDGAPRAATRSVFAANLDAPFGIAFYPAGPDPRWVYVAETNRVLRFAYRSGDVQARGPAEVVVGQLAPGAGGHTTRDVVFSADGHRMFVSVGSGSNVAEAMTRKSPADTQAWARGHAPGAAWGSEERRADVLAFAPEGGPARVFAAGIRNCVGLAVQPGHGDLWCSTNERDGLGDNLVPDYVTHVREGGFYGWPWWYVGDHEDPRRRGERPDLKGRVDIPDVLLQPHSASLQLAFYDGAMFPEWRGSILAAEHGSWNRAARTGYKLIRIPVRADGAAEGGYEDILTGFVVDDDRVWGRPVGVTVAHDGAVLVSEDGSDTIWRIAR